MQKKTVIKPFFNSINVRSVEAIAQSIIRIRKLYALSQVDLAKKTGLTQATISRIESGSKKVTLETLVLIFSALNIDLVITPRLKQDPAKLLKGLF
jgi:transcriptional regulator with XRE-family HTH domain